MTRDAMTGGDWALWAASTAIYIALIAWLVTSALREHRGAADKIIAEAAAEVVAEAEHYTRQAS